MVPPLYEKDSSKIENKPSYLKDLFGFWVHYLVISIMYAAQIFKLSPLHEVNFH